MKRTLHLGLTLLCLLALIVTPVLCGHVFQTARTGCEAGMAGSMPMPQQHTVPPCCATHSTHHPAQAEAASDHTVLASAPVSSALPVFLAREISVSHAPLHLIAPPIAFRPPLRI